MDLEVLKKQKKYYYLSTKKNNELKKQNQELLKAIHEANLLVKNILKDRK